MFKQLKKLFTPNFDPLATHIEIKRRNIEDCDGQLFLDLLKKNFQTKTTYILVILKFECFNHYSL